jgi:Na+/melibiose symporter-like transporter
MSAVLQAGAEADETGFGLREGLRYGALGLPLAFLAIPLYVHLPSHYAERGLALPMLGLVLLLTRFADALADPFIGLAVDRWLARSCRVAWRACAAAALVVVAGFWALFFPPRGVPLVGWLAATLPATYAGFSVLVVVHQAWGVRLGGDAARRARIVGWREGFGLVGVVAASVIPLVLGLVASAALLALGLALGLALLARAPQPAGESAPVATGWRLPWRDADFRRLLLTFMFNGIASAIPATLVLFFIRDRLQLAGSEPWFLALYFLGAACSLPGWVRAAGRMGLARAWWFGMLLAVAAFGWAWGLGAGDVAGFGAVCLASGIALGADLALPGALLSGIVQRARHGQAAQGVYAGWWNTASKLNLGLAAGITLPLLSWTGYAPGRQDAAALAALGAGYVLVPCLLKLMAAGLVWRWWLQPEKDE